MIHVRKVLPEYFEALRTGRKRFELRKEEPDEPSFAVGDFLAVNEYEPTLEPLAECYTGRCLLFEILYVLRNYDAYLTEGTAVLSLSLRPLGPDDVAAIR